MAYIPLIDSDRLEADAVTSAKILNGTILNEDINASAAIAYSKLNLSSSIVPADFDASVTLDDFTAAGTVNMNSNQFSNLATASASGQAVEYSQFAAAIDGLDYKDAVLVATTANITLSGEQTIDGVLTSGSRVLVKDQSTASENGIYVSASGAWARSADADTAAEITDGATVWVQQGTANADTRWTETATVTTLGSDNVVFAQTGSATSVSAISDLSDVDTTGAVDGALLRYESGSSEWQDTVAGTLLLSDAGQLQVATTGASAGILLGGDAQLYRSNPNELRTPDSLVVDVDLSVAGDMTSNARFLDVVSKAVGDSPYSVAATDDVVLVDSSGGAVTVNLPAAASNTGRRLRIKDSGGASNTNAITIDGNASETIDGAATFPVDENYMAVDLICDGSGWFVL